MKAGEAVFALLHQPLVKPLKVYGIFDLHNPVQRRRSLPSFTSGSDD